MFAPFFVLFGLMAVGYLCRKFDSIDDVKNDGLGSMVQLSMLTSNNGFMGFSITMAFFGQQGLKIPLGCTAEGATKLTEVGDRNHSIRGVISEQGWAWVSAQGLHARPACSRIR